MKIEGPPQQQLKDTVVTEGCSPPLPAAYSSQGHITGVPESNPAATRLEVRLWDTGSSQYLHMIYCRGPSSALRAAKMSQGERRSRSRNRSGTSENSGASILTEHQRNSPSSLALLDHVVFFFLLSERSMFYFSSHLEDLCVTLIRGGSECLAVFSVNPKAPAHAGKDLLGRKWLFLERQRLPDLTADTS